MFDLINFMDFCKGRPQKAQSFTSKDAEVHHFVEKLCGQIVQQFKINVSEHTIVRNLGILHVLQQCGFVQRSVGTGLACLLSRPVSHEMCGTL